MRRADRAMPNEQMQQLLDRGLAGRLATVSADGYPYCLPLLFVWADNQIFLHGTSVQGHLQSNVRREPRACFEIDEPGDVFDYGRFECDSGLAYGSVILFGRIQVAEDTATKLRAADGEIRQAEFDPAEELLSAARCDHRLCHARRANDRQGAKPARCLRAMAGARPHHDAQRAAVAACRCAFVSANPRGSGWRIEARPQAQNKTSGGISPEVHRNDRYLIVLRYQLRCARSSMLTVS